MIPDWIAVDGGVSAATAAVLFAVSFLYFAARLFALRRMRTDPADFTGGVSNALAKGGLDEALAICEDAPGPVPEVAAAVLRSSGAPAAMLRDVASAAADAAEGRMRRMAAPFAVLAQTAPLVGLIGTVAGMLRIVYGAAGDDIVSRPQLLGGLSYTLLAAGAGLVLAVAAHMMFAVLDAAAASLAEDARSAGAAMAAALARGADAKTGKGGRP